MEQLHGVGKTSVYASNNDVRAVRQGDQETGQKQCLHQKCPQPRITGEDQAMQWGTMAQEVTLQVDLRMEAEQIWPARMGTHHDHPYPWTS